MPRVPPPILTMGMAMGTILTRAMALSLLKMAPFVVTRLQGASYRGNGSPSPSLKGNALALIPTWSWWEGPIPRTRERFWPEFLGRLDRSISLAFPLTDIPALAGLPRRSPNLRPYSP